MEALALRRIEKFSPARQSLWTPGRRDLFAAALFNLLHHGVVLGLVLGPRFATSAGAERQIMPRLLLLYGRCGLCARPAFRRRCGRNSGGQALAAAGPAGRNHFTATDRRHPGAKAMPALAHQFAWLISPLHVSLRLQNQQIRARNAEEPKRSPGPPPRRLSPRAQMPLPGLAGRARRKRGEGRNREPYKGRIAKKSIWGTGLKVEQRPAARA
jgi:hypothetical protein